MSTLQQSLESLRKLVREHDVTKLGMPHLGCGLDRLNWDAVTSLIKKVFHDVKIELAARWIHSAQVPYANAMIVAGVCKGRAGTGASSTGAPYVPEHSAARSVDSATRESECEVVSHVSRCGWALVCSGVGSWVDSPPSPPVCRLPGPADTTALVPQPKPVDIRLKKKKDDRIEKE